MRDVAIIGAGPGGCFAALAAARGGARVTVYERNAKPLKKLLASGNGRGNLLNTGAPAYYGDAAFARAVLARVPAERLRAEWEALGVPLRQEDEGRVYPAALMASAAADALLLALEAAGVRIVCGARVDSVTPAPGGGYLVRWTQAAADERDPKGKKPAIRGCADAPAVCAARDRADAPALRADAPAAQRREARCDAVIIAAGGQAAPALGATGDSLALLSALGHDVTPTRPALCALRTDAKPIAGLAGLRVRAALTLLDASGHPLRQTAGEALFAEDGVSGIAAMQLGRFAEPGCALRLDLRPALCVADESALLERLAALREARAGFATDRLLLGWFAERLARRLTRLAGLPAEGRIGALRDGELRRVARLLCDWRLPVLGARDWTQAQVTAGGARTAQFDPESMQSRLHAGLYAVGEALDVDGDCGGYNLMFACAGGLIAGEHACGV